MFIFVIFVSQDALLWHRLASCAKGQIPEIVRQQSWRQVEEKLSGKTAVSPDGQMSISPVTPADNHEGFDVLEAYGATPSQLRATR